MEEAEASTDLAPQDFVLRRVHRNHFKPHLPTPIERLAFCPNPQDTTGISVYAEKLVSAEMLVKKDPRLYHVARLSVQVLKDLRLTLRQEEDEVDHLPGHYVIPQLAYGEYRRDEKGSKEVQRERASEDIVLRPPEVPLVWKSVGPRGFFGSGGSWRRSSSARSAFSARRRARTSSRVSSGHR